MSKIQGGDMMLFIDGVSIGYATNHTLEIEADLSSFDCKDEGEQGWSNEETVMLNWSATSDNIYAHDPQGQSYEQLYDLMLSRTPIDAVFYKKKEGGSNVPTGGWTPDDEPYHGKVIITDLDMNAPHGDYATFSATFTGWGELVYDELVDYLCTRTLLGGTFYFLKNFEDDPCDIEYSTDKVNWTTLSNDTETEYFDAQTNIYWRATFTKTCDPENQYHNGVGTLKSDSRFIVSGNPMSLIRPDIFYTMTDISEYEGAFAGLFQGNEESLISATKLHLKALTLSKNCYSGMFSDCYNLQRPPELPATNLAERCYEGMFQFCNRLEKAPELPATVMKEKCYSSMFQGCTDLTKAPDLPATQLAEACYMYMFESCGRLEKAPKLPAMTLAQACYYSMFQGCDAIRVLPNLPATTLAPSCYGSMFRGCGALNDISQCPSLPATELEDSCYEYMFMECVNLVSAPDLPATELAPNCYKAMFQGCTKLRTAPDLLAQSRVPYTAYQNMFYGCSALTSIKCYAGSITTPDGSWTTTISFTNWVNGVNSTGQFIKFVGATWQTGNSGIPSNWTVTESNTY